MLAGFCSSVDKDSILCVVMLHQWGLDSDMLRQHSVFIFKRQNAVIRSDLWRCGHKVTSKQNLVTDWCNVISHKNRIFSIKISHKCHVLNDWMLQTVEQWSKYYLLLLPYHDRAQFKWTVAFRFRWMPNWWIMWSTVYQQGGYFWLSVCVRLQEEWSQVYSSQWYVYFSC